MEEKINLSQLEKQSAASLFQTGLVEIEIGLILLVSALAMMFDDIRYYLDILYIVPVIFIVLAVKYVANPRLGVVNLAKKRVRKTRLMGIVITTFLVVMVTLTIIGDTNTIDQLVNPRWSITGIIFMICVAIAYFMGFDRMYFYAFVMAGTFNLSEEIREHPGILPNGGFAYLLASVILIIIGSFYLARFLKNYPLPKLKDTNGQ